MQTLKSYSASCFQCFVLITFYKKDKCSCVSWTSCRLLHLYMKQANWMTGNLSTKFLFLKFFLILKHNSKAAAVVVKNHCFRCVICPTPWSFFNQTRRAHAITCLICRSLEMFQNMHQSDFVKSKKCFKMILLKRKSLKLMIY